MRYFFIGLVILIFILAIAFSFHMSRSFSNEKEYTMNTLVPGKLIVLTNAPFKPLEYMENGSLVGFDIDVARAIGKRLGLEVNIRHEDWDLMFELVRQGKVDFAISGITATKERAKDFNFSVPYLEAGQSLLISSKQENEIRKVEDIKDKKIIAQKNTTGSTLVNSGGGILIERESIGDVEINELEKGVIDGIVVDYVVAATFAKENKNIRLVEPQLNEEYYVALFPQLNQDVVLAVNSVIREMKRDGELDQLKKQWFR